MRFTVHRNLLIRLQPVCSASPSRPRPRRCGLPTLRTPSSPAFTNSPPAPALKCCAPEATPSMPPSPPALRSPSSIPKPETSAEADSSFSATPTAKPTSSTFAKKRPPLLPKTCISTPRATSSRLQQELERRRIQIHWRPRLGRRPGLRREKIWQAVARKSDRPRHQTRPRWLSARLRRRARSAKTTSISPSLPNPNASSSATETTISPAKSSSNPNSPARSSASPKIPTTSTTALMARELAAAIHKGGGLVTAADLAAYEVKEREPIRGSYRGYDIISAPPPSSGRSRARRNPQHS